MRHRAGARVGPSSVSCWCCAGAVRRRTLHPGTRSSGTSRRTTPLLAEDLTGLVTSYKDLVREHTGRDFPQDPREQLDMAVLAVFESWNTDRAVLYRRQERIPGDLGTAVNVCTMVFGNGGDDSGTGVAFTRDPASGAQGVYGDYLQNAQGEDVVAGIRNTVSLADMQDVAPGPHAELLRIMALLEEHYRDLCDIEFTVERGTLGMLQTRVGKRTAAAAFRIAMQLVDEGLIDGDEALAIDIPDLDGRDAPAMTTPDTSAPLSSLPDGLSRREVEVLRLIATGLSTREIADRLVISSHTVERHITHAYGKIGARGRAEATAYALRHGLV